MFRHIQPIDNYSYTFEHDQIRFLWHKYLTLPYLSTHEYLWSIFVHRPFGVSHIRDISVKRNGHKIDVISSSLGEVLVSKQFNLFHL